MNFSFWASNKIKLSHSSGANATGVAIAVAGVALAVIIMECTLGIVLGFKNQITERIIGFDSQLTVSPPLNQETGAQRTYLSKSPALYDAIESTLPSASVAMKMHMPGILKTDADFAGAYFVAYDSGHDYEFERNAVIQGRLPDFFSSADANKIAISSSMAKNLGLGLGDAPYAYFFENEAVKQRRLEIAAIYETGFSDYDKTIVFAPISSLRGIAGVDSLSATSISIDGVPFGQIEACAERLQQKLITLYTADDIDGLYPVDNVRHTGSMFFSWLDLLDTNVTVIFILMACVAGFTLISSMFILILDRIPEIGLLRSLGATKRQVRMIFVNLAMKIIARGLIVGNVAGIGALLLQQRLHLLKLDPQMYYLPYVPVEINWWWMLWLNIAVLAAGWCILVIPSALAAGVSPASTMRYE